MQIKRVFWPIIVVFSLIWRGLAWLFNTILGEFQWTAPRWVRIFPQIRIAIRQNPGPSIAMLMLFVAGGVAYGYSWYWFKYGIQPRTVAYTLQPPALTNYRETPITVHPLAIQFAESAAPLDNINKAISKGVTLSPNIPGEWRWDDDRTLRFQPAQDWPVAQEYTVQLDKKILLAPDLLLRSYQTTFHTSSFIAKVESTEFYQDPVDTSLKKLVATVSFSHPVDEDSVRERIHLTLGKGLQYRDKLAKNEQPFAVTFDEQKLAAFIHSVPLAVPLETTPVELTIDKKIGSSLGGNRTDYVLKTSINIDGRYRLSFDNLRMDFANNEKGEPEQVLFFQSSHPVTDKNIEDKVQVWLLPERFDANGRRVYYGYQELTEALKSTAKPLAITHIPSAEPLNAQHAFRFKAKPDQEIYVAVAAGVEAVGGYIAKNGISQIVRVSPYPKTLHLLSEGSLLSLNGEKKLGFMARGINSARVEIARILPQQLHHLVANNQGSISQPRMSEQQFDQLVEREQITIDLANTDDGKTVFDHVDLGAYLNHDGGRKGVFVIRLTNTADDVTQTFDGYYSNYYDYADNGNSTSDLRFVVVTDLGIIVKKSVDGTQDVFVQSLSSGKPVGGASVTVLGKNGLPVKTERSDYDGRVTFTQLGELKREKAPLMYLVENGQDMAFLPVNAYNQQLNFSRFDIGGLTRASEPTALSAYLFTDRGLYRPGETTHLHTLVRTANWQGLLAGLPLTLQITDPRGVSVQETLIALSESGFDAVDFTSGSAAPAGDYQAHLYLMKPNNERELLGSTQFVVRDFEPDRLKVNVRLADTASDGWIKPEQVAPVVQALHLFGAPAGERKVKASMQLQAILPAFSAYPDYRFHLSDRLQIGVKEDLTDALTDAQGEASLSVDLKRFVASTYRLTILARVFEAGGGRNVQAENSVLVSSADYLLGIKATDNLSYISKGDERSVAVVAVDSQLNPVPVENLNLELYEYRYVSVLVKQRNGTMKFESRRKDILLNSNSLAVSAGEQTLSLPTDNPGDFIYVIKNAAGEVQNQVEFTVAGSGNVTRSLERNAELQLRLSKSSYSPGETVEVNIRAPYVGSGLITIERDKIYAAQWFTADTLNSVQTIRIPETLEGNAYINVQFVRDPSSSEVYMSPLSYGVAPFSIALDARKLDVSVTTPEVVIPGDTLNFNLITSEAARVVLFAVDEGILQVAGYKNPDPLAFFFQKQALQVDTVQILNLILPEFSQLMNAAAPGGDGEQALANFVNPFKRKRAKPAVYWSGLVDVPAGGQTFSYTTPDTFNGKLRIIAVAVTAQKVGVFAGATEVRGPIILTPNIPAFIAPKDEILVTTGVFNNLPSASKITLTLTTSDGLKNVEGSQNSVILDVGAQKEATASFRLLGTDALGSADLWFTATTEVQDATTTVKLHETTSVRPAVPYRTQLTVARTDKKSTDILPTRDLFDPFRQVEFGAGFSPLVWMRGLENYLGNYQYLCTEQLVSKALPALVLTAQDELAGGKSPAIDNAINILMQRQNSQGGFGLWSASVSVDPYVSSYAADFLLEAKERGYPVPRAVLERASAYLEYLANQPSDGMVEMRARAYATYLLTRSGKITTRILANITDQLNTYQDKQWQQDITAAYMAASYALLKQDDLANKMIKQVPWRVLVKDPGVYSIYYDDLTHDTFLLTLIARHFPEQTRKVPAELLDQFGERISQNQYHSLSAANLLRAMDLYDAQVATNGDIKVSATLKNKQIQVLSMLNKPPRADVPQDTASVNLQKLNGAHAYYLLSEAGFDRQIPEATISKGIEVVSEFQNLRGDPLGDPAQVQVGEEFLIQVRVRATERDQIHQIALMALLPGGVEPVMNPPVVADPAQTGEQTQEEQEYGGWQSPVGDYSRSSWYPEFVDVRDDRLVLYGTVERAAQTFVFRVRAINAGQFQGPPPYAEAMYEPTLQARGKPSSLEIKEP